MNYYISYTIADENGRAMGTGSMVYPLASGPRTLDEVNALAAQLTDEQHLSGGLHAGASLRILS